MLDVTTGQRVVPSDDGWSGPLRDLPHARHR